MNKTFNIEIPFFPGFYESPLYYSDMLYYEIDDELLETYSERCGCEVTQDDIDIHFDEYAHDVCEKYLEGFVNEAPDFVVSATMDEMVSPKEYNFKTDTLYADVELAENWQVKVLAYIAKNYDSLEARIKKDWSDRDGFWSFMSNKIDEWIDELSKDEEIDERYITEILRYMMYDSNHNINERLYLTALDDIYVGEYLYCTKEKESE